MHYIFQLLLFITGLLSSALVFGQNQENDLKERAVIEYIQSLPASKVNPKLPSISYEQWLKQIVGDVKLEWEINDCGEGGDKPIDEPVPACVSVSTPQWHCPSVDISLMVSGEYEDMAPQGDAVFWYGGVSDFGIETRYINDLSNLEVTVKEVDLSAARHRPTLIPAPSVQGMTPNDFAAHVAKLDVHQLDPSLRPERFDGWLSRIDKWGLLYTVVNPIYKKCGSNEILVYLKSTLTADSEKRPPPVNITFNLGTWEEGISINPKLSIIFGEGAAATHLESLGELQEKMNEWIREIKTTDIECNNYLAACRNRRPCVSMNFDGVTCDRTCQFSILKKLYDAGLIPIARTSPSLPLSCVGYRNDIDGTEEGAKCIAKLLGYRFRAEGYGYPALGCNVDGYPYSVWVH